MTKIEAIQFKNELISDYLDGKMDGDGLFEFETEIITNVDLEKEVALEVLSRMRNERLELDKSEIEKKNLSQSFDQLKMNQTSKAHAKGWLSKYFQPFFK